MATTTFTAEYTRPDASVPFWHEYAAADGTRASQLAAYDQFLKDNCGVISITRTVVGNVMTRIIVVSGAHSDLFLSNASLINASMPGYGDSIMDYYDSVGITLTNQTHQVN